ncbi:hypothetical protein HNQ59_003607 [Chitinivorax tropicus]|uniref:Uncharacterized protein n=1 Tax=Chitinivorax tropicus TaxID=714531 RepID=A0A840MNR8_9PROT|nr:hypothetical protein [Chitinivorax tropicus]
MTKLHPPRCGLQHAGQYPQLTTVRDRDHVSYSLNFLFDLTPRGNTRPRR